MSYGLFNLARMTVSSSGTSTITLNAAVTGFLTFDLAGCSTASTGQAVTYAINDTTQTEIGRGTYTSSALTLTRGSSTNGLKSTNGNSPINMSNAAQVFITPSANDLNNSFGQCQLQYTSTTTLTLMPFNGNRLTINGVNEIISSAGVTWSASAAVLTSSTTYYAYAYMSSGVMTLEGSTTSYATDVNTGMPVKSNDVTRTLVGMVRQESTAWVDTARKRFTRSYFNRQPAATFAALTSSTISSTSATFTYVSSALLYNEFLTWSNEKISVYTTGAVSVSSGAALYSGIGLDTATNPDVTTVFENTVGSAYLSNGGTNVIYTAGISEGLHAAVAITRVLGGTGNFFYLASNSAFTLGSVTIQS
jgi:outer membrane protein assembly factor BamE (lipoprotein component of BamABCDE complex)